MQTLHYDQIKIKYEYINNLTIYNALLSKPYQALLTQTLACYKGWFFKKKNSLKKKNTYNS